MRSYARVFEVAILMLLWLQSCLWGAAGISVDYTRRLWRATDGLPDQTVQATVQTPDGYLWIGTKGGLLRFDGNHFMVYDHENTPGLSESSVNCLFVSHDGSLWIGTEGGGLLRLAHRSFRSYPTADGASNGFIRAIYEDNKGVVWVGADQGLFQVAGASLKRIDGTNGVPAVFVRSIIQDRAGDVWVGGTRLLVFDGGKAHEYPLPGGPSRNLVTAMVQSGDGTIWAGTLSGLYSVTGAGALHKAADITWPVQVLCEGTDGRLWVGTLGGGVFVRRQHSFSAMTAPSFLPSNTVLAIFEDREKNVWIGTPAGILRLSRSAVNITALPDATDSQYETVYQDHDGSVWAASARLFHIQNGAATPVVFPQIARARVRTVFRDRGGNLWIGTDGNGLYQLAGKRVRHFTHEEGLSNDFIRAIMQSRDGSLWVGTDGGLSHIGPKGITAYNTPNGLAYFSVTALREDRQGDLWIGTSRGLSHLRDGTFLKDAATGALRQEKLWSIHEDPQGGLWFGTSRGLYRYRDGTLAHYTTAQGLASNIIYQILEDSAANLWLSSPQSVSRVNRHDLDSIGGPEVNAADPPRLSLTLFPVSQESAELYGGMQPAGFLSRRGDVVFPSNKGLVHVQTLPARQKAVPSFPVAINRVIVDGQNLPVAQKIVIAPGEGRLEISYAAILLRSQEALRYRYKLEGLDKSWNRAFARRTAYYTNLPAGEYRFRVRAYETNNPEAASEASMEVVQRPHLYRTGWFAGICLGGLALSVWGAYRYRLRQLRMRFDAVLEERNRLAREMHDTLIQGCTSVSALLEAVASTDFAHKDLSRELVDHARRQVRETIDEARSAVWNLRHRAPGQERINALIEKMAERMARDSGIPVRCESAGRAKSLSAAMTHEVLMIVREALSNAVVHGRPERIDVKIMCLRGDLKIEILDNGRGFAAGYLQTEGHYGLLGMRERTEHLGGELRLTTLPGGGSAVAIQIPCGKRGHDAAFAKG